MMLRFEKTQRSQNGFTLIELLVVTGILAAYYAPSVAALVTAQLMHSVPTKTNGYTIVYTPAGGATPQSATVGGSPIC